MADAIILKLTQFYDSLSLFIAQLGCIYEMFGRNFFVIFQFHAIHKEFTICTKNRAKGLM